jgi:hypothetical protein
VLFSEPPLTRAFAYPLGLLEAWLLEAHEVGLGEGPQQPTFRTEACKLARGEIGLAATHGLKSTANYRSQQGGNLASLVPLPFHKHNHTPVLDGVQGRRMPATTSSESSMLPVTTRAWLDILRGALMMLPAAPAPSEVVAMVREKGGQEEEELAWLEALAGCLGAAVAMAREQSNTAVHR